MTIMIFEESERKQFDVALSFAGEDRVYVEKVADTLLKMDINVFYDKHETATLWGKDLFTYLQDIYQNKANYTIIFCSEHYAKKLWTNHERKAAQARAFESSEEYILPARFDNAKIPGILPTTGYVDLREYSPEEFAKLIKEKLGPIRRINFFPDDPDRLYKELKLKSKKSKKIAYQYAYRFFKSMKLMTVDERILFTNVLLESCTCGHPHEIHQDLNYLSRVLKLTPEEIKQCFSRLDSLSFYTTVRDIKLSKTELHYPDELITIKYMIVSNDEIKNATCIIFPIIEILRDRCCKECFWECISEVDFSPLSSLSGYDENIEN